MGVHGLWDLLAPVGRRVSVETLAGKRLAIDASIWMVQFMKAMRDERGEMLRNAHLIGFFRRICKLLFLRTKPVFVFDGGTPALKRRTVIARRRQRENAQAKIRKTAEKLLLNHVKAMRVKELANNLQDQRDKNNSKGKEILLDESDSLKKNEAASEGYNQEMVDEMLAASMEAEESGVLATASGCAAEIGSSSGNTSASVMVFPKEVEDDEDEEMILPITDGNVDPAVLASLPPSMQLDLLVRMRERLMAENRQKYQRVKKAPQNFSELQIEAYLKTVAFRREIDQVQKAASGKAVGGVQTSRIASESNREFIFSSSFSGDKQNLVAGGAAKIPENQQRMEKNGSAFEILNAMASATKDNAEAEPTVEEDVETFIDENGHRRVSRRRAMGIRMTRDLQRNIDLLKELEQEKTPVDIEANDRVDVDNDGQSRKSVKALFNLDVAQSSIVNSLSESEIRKDTPRSESCIEISFDDDVKQTSLDGDDEIFAHLVSGDQVPICFGENSNSDCDWEDGLISRESGTLIDGSQLESNSFHAQDENNESDVEWEEGTSIVGEKLSMKSFDAECSEDKDIGVEWKGLNVTDVYEDDRGFCTADDQKTVSKGSVEEEAALQEAIRRSLEDLTGGTTSCVSGKLKISDYACNRELQLKSCSTLPSSDVRSVLDGDKQSQSLIDDCGPSFLDGKGTYGSSSPGMHSTSVTFVAAGAAPRIDFKEDLNEQQLNASVKNVQINKAVERDSNASTDMAADILGTLPKNVCDDVANNKAPSTLYSEGFGYSIGQTPSVLEEQTSHSIVKQTVREDDTCPVSVQEQSNDLELLARKDKENTSEPLGSNFEDELLVLGEEYKNLGEEQRKLERNADSVNAEMFVECQELLQMFGLPYIIAPMEAEAQCAYMELANLVDGVVTDDSDVFLFGAKSVYKNIFDDRKYVETYFLKDIESELGLDREKLIRMALLLGSDYTEGISGIGIVNAIEVINAFPEEDGFHKFREWIESPDPAIFGKVGGQLGSKSKKKGSKKNGVSTCTKEMEGDSAAASNSLLEDEDDEARNGIQKIKQTFMNKHRNVSKNWHLPASFPSNAVISAYTDPQVDKSNEPFAWGKPDIFSLRRLCWEKFAWASQKADELLLPVLKEYNKHETQLRLEAFYTFNERFAKIRSKRIQKAVKGIVGKPSLDLDVADNLQENSAKKEQTEEGASGNIKKKSLPKRKHNVVGDNKNSAKKPKSQLDKGEQREVWSTEVEIMGPCTDAEKESLNDAGASRGRGRQKRKHVGRGRPKENSYSECNVTSISSSDKEQELLAGNIEVPRGVRRSKRVRKAASYLEEDEESDGLVFPVNITEKKCNEGADEPKSSHNLSVHEPDINNVSEESEFKSHDLPEHGSPGNYLVNGGGFCAEDEDETVKETNSEYLHMGGGFCVEDEGGESNITDAYISTTFTETREASQTFNPCKTATDLASDSDLVQNLQKGPLSDSQQNLGDKHETTDSNPSNVTVSNNNVTQTTVNPFSATPLLKRKRRKS